ncbi:transglycosylase domain-containing protein [Virgibacillus xinjiangensis]|uniref:Transglycosylase domain-containing protein n=1 Tax=Virgibacillus xinjiangensis TaxID=393090 RepID=A0ABV7CTS1_9BACI
MGKKTRRFIWKAGIRLVLLGVLLLAGVYGVSYLLGPPPLTDEQNTVYYDDAGEVFGEESRRKSNDWKELDELSSDLVAATILVEDQHFYDHPGFDFKRIAGAMWKNIQSGRLKEGASTLTQQYARNLYLSHEKTWSRKLKEAFYTIRLEMFYTKDEILEGYLNSVYYGHGAYGAEAASQLFFRKSAEDVSLAEASMLAAIPKGPTYYSPWNDEENAENRQNQILSIMLEHGAITETAYQQAVDQKLTYAPKQTREVDQKAPYFQDAALSEAAEILDMEQEDVRSGGYGIHTTLNMEQQEKLESELEEEFHSTSEAQAGALAMDPENGAVRAMSGGRDYETSSFNRATSARRMPGSSFKPFLYYAALENGYTPATMLMSKPTSFRLEDGEVYQPSNYHDYYANEEITLAQAIALSDNVYAVKTNMYLGSEMLVETAKDFGFTSKLPAVPSLALGTAAVTVEEMVQAYSLLANGGEEVQSHTVKKIIDRHGKTLYEREQEEGEQVLDAKTAFILTHMLTGIFDRELDGYMAVTGSPIAGELTHIYAGKSGTTASDSWMVGYSPSLVTGVWVGYDDNRSMDKVPETRYAKKIWAGFMEGAHEGKEQQNFSAPPGVVGIPVDPETGERATPYCNASRVMYFEKGTEPRQYCSEHYHQEEFQQEEKKEKGIVEKWFELLF